MNDPEAILGKVLVLDGAQRRLMEAGWRFQLIGPLLDESKTEEQRARHRAETLGRVHEHPWRGQINVAARTLRRWCQAYRANGLTGLVPTPRKDVGQAIKLPRASVERALQLRAEDPRRGVPQLIRLMVAEKPEWADILKRTTLDRHLRASGSVRWRKAPMGPYHSFEASEPCDLWQGDTLVGPVVKLGDGQSVRCKVVCWLDDHSRYACHLQAYPDETLASIEDSLRRAIAKHGAPRKIFVDNALTYSSKSLELACSQLGVVKVHSTPHYPVSRGKQERFFGTLRQQLIQELENLETLTLDELNRHLINWLDLYHFTAHSRTKESPAARFARLKQRRLLPADLLSEAFLQWDIRAISCLGEIKFSGNIYRVDPALACPKAVIRFDPDDLSRIFVWKNGIKVAVSSASDLVHRTRPGQTKRPRTQTEAAQQYLSWLEQRHRERRAQELNLIDYTQTEEAG